MTRKIVRAVNTEFCQSSFWIWNKNESIFWSFAAFTDWWQQITILRMVDSFISIFMSFHIIYCCSKPSFFFRESGIWGGSGRGIPKPTYESKSKILIPALKANMFYRQPVKNGIQDLATRTSRNHYVSFAAMYLNFFERYYLTAYFFFWEKYYINISLNCLKNMLGEVKI